MAKLEKSKVEKYLMDKGFNPTYKGFRYLVFAICNYADAKNYREEICDEIAKEYKVTTQQVERTMSYTLECVKRTNREALPKFCTTKNYIGYVYYEIINEHETIKTDLLVKKLKIGNNQMEVFKNDIFKECKKYEDAFKNGKSEGVRFSMEFLHGRFSAVYQIISVLGLVKEYRDFKERLEKNVV